MQLRTPEEIENYVKQHAFSEEIITEFEDGLISLLEEHKDIINDIHVFLTDEVELTNTVKGRMSDELTLNIIRVGTDGKENYLLDTVRLIRNEQQKIVGFEGVEVVRFQ